MLTDDQKETLIAAALETKRFHRSEEGLETKRDLLSCVEAIVADAVAAERERCKDAIPAALRSHRVDFGKEEGRVNLTELLVARIETETGPKAPYLIRLDLLISHLQAAMDVDLAAAIRDETEGA